MRAAPDDKARAEAWRVMQADTPVAAELGAFRTAVAQRFGDEGVREMLRAARRGEQAGRMVRGLRGFPLLDGARGRPRACVEELVDAVVALSDAALAHRGRLVEADVNPFVVSTVPGRSAAVATDHARPQLGAAAQAARRWSIGFSTVRTRSARTGA